MAFHDSPKVDNNAELSEESVLMVKSIFTRKTGFISREELPDYGVDLSVELVADRNATSNVFPVQIKSANAISVIKHSNIDYVSIEFTTSRLGYLCRRPPSYGIVVVYDESTKVAYFDFVEEIVKRLNDHRGNDEWMGQEKVNIRIPLIILNNESASQIHEKMSFRFRSNQLLLNAFGELYRIPSLGLKSDGDETDFNDPKQVESILRNSGLDLFNSKAYDMITGLLSRLPQMTIMKSKEMVLLAAITYGQTGMIVECEYFLGKCSLYPPGDYNEDESFLLYYTKIMLQFKKGNLQVEEFKKEVSLLKTKSKNQLNILTLDINLIYIKFLQSDQGQIDKTLLGAIDEVFLRIQQSDISDSDKALLKLFNLENLHNYGTSLFLKDGGKFKIQEKLGLNIPMQERLIRVKEVIRIISTATNGVHEILKESIESKDKLVNAFAAYYKARFFFSMRFQTMMLAADEPPSSIDTPASLYDNTLDFCYQSISLFFELSLLQEAHQALCCAYDLQILYRLLYKAEAGKKSFDEITESLRKVEQATGLKRHESTVESTFIALASSKDIHDGSWSGVPDDQVERFAKVILDGYGIPENRLANIIIEINALKAFSRECKNPDLELLFELKHLRSAETAYANRPIFFIRSRKTGIESKKSSNINELLEQFGGILKNSGTSN